MTLADFTQRQIDFWPELRILPAVMVAQAVAPMFRAYEEAKKLQDLAIVGWLADGGRDA